MLVDALLFERLGLIGSAGDPILAMLVTASASSPLRELAGLPLFHRGAWRGIGSPQSVIHDHHFDPSCISGGVPISSKDYPHRKQDPARAGCPSALPSYPL